VRALWRLLTRRRSQTVFVIGLPLAVLGTIAVAFAWTDGAPSSVQRGVTSRALEAEARAIAPRDGASLLSTHYRPAPCTGGDGSTAPENILRVAYRVDEPPAEVMATTLARARGRRWVATDTSRWEGRPLSADRVLFGQGADSDGDFDLLLVEVSPDTRHGIRLRLTIYGRGDSYRC
jgi:hypothetical protein